MKTLELYEGSVPCVQCGYCCKVRSCGYGKWDEEKHQCSELVAVGDGTYNCGVFDKIVKGKDTSWHLAPAFGAGCCASINTYRADILRKAKRHEKEVR